MTLQINHCFTLAFTVLLVCLLPGCSKENKALRTQNIAPEGAFSITISPKFTVVGSVDGTAKVWPAKAKKPLYSWLHGSDNPEGIVASAIEANEKFAITAERNSLAWWRLTDGILLGSWSFDGIHSVSLAAGGHYALIGLANKAVYFSLSSGKTLFAFAHNGPVTTTALSLNGAFGLTGSVDRTAKLWSLKTGKLAHTWQHQTKISCVALSQKGTYAMTNAHLGGTRVWKTATGKLKRIIGPKLMTVSAATFSPNEKSLLTGRVSQRIDLWSIKSGKNLRHWTPKKQHTWRPSATPIVSLQFFNHGKSFVSASSSGYIQKWRIKSKK